jgi:pimeloyl-ACP methyl ester carboxylesterase
MADLHGKNRLWRRLALAAGGYVLYQQAWAFWRLARISVQQTLNTQRSEAPPGLTFSDVRETETYIRTHTVEDGIEQIVYEPKKRRFETPIIMQHGMWHGAWCWELWQELFAEWGWETRAHSLPGHAQSPVQRPIKLCTLDYYLSFLKTEVARSPARPALMGHSMGGALTQWYLKYVGDDLAATVLVAPWVSHSMFLDGLWPMVTYDPLAPLLMMLTWDATPMVRAGRGSAVRFLVGPDAVVPLDKLQPKLGPESALVLYQHNPPFWSPPKRVQTPMLWIAGEDDPLLLEPAERRSAAHYKADYIVAAHARHNVMMEHNFRDTAEQVHQWLAGRGVR